MAGILNEYLSRRMGILDLQSELQELIKKYNEYTKRLLFVYAADINKGRVKGVDVSLVQDDFYTIQDILRENLSQSIDFYIETPGGSGEAAEEVARFLRKKFPTGVNFVIAGEAKSAGTILALSGDKIYMTETGSLGPIDAQVRIGRSVISAHDYKEWVDSKREEAAINGSLNPFDAVMVSQISPGELFGVINSLEFAKDLVKEWLEKYKFKNWKKTETNGRSVTAQMRKDRANEVAEMLCNHTNWRTHGRSLKIEDLNNVLKINNIDEDPQLADIVYRIKTIIRMIFDSSTIYKIYYLQDFKLAKTFTVNQPGGGIPMPQPSSSAKKANKTIERAEIDVKCPKCGKNHIIFGYFNKSSKEISTQKLETNSNINENDILICDNCSYALDLKPLKSQIENQTNRRVSFK